MPRPDRMARSSGEARRRRILRRGSRFFAVTGVLALLAGIALLPPTPVPTFEGRVRAAAGGGGGGGSLPPINLTVRMTDGPRYDPAELSVPAGAKVNLTVVNTGSIDHSFTLLNRPNFVVNRSWTPTELDAYFVANGSQANVSVSGGGNVTLSLTFNSVQAGFSFEFLSQVPYQFQAGMFGFLNVTGGSAGPGLVANVTAAVAGTAWLEPAIAVDTAAFPVAIDMQVINAGSSAHTFWLEAQPNYTLQSGNFTSYFTQHPPAAQVTLSSNPGEAVWANFTLSKPGVYEFICNVPGHFANGMFGFLYVGVPAPAQAAAPSSELVSAWVLYGAAGLLGLGGLLAAAAFLVGRFPRGPPGGGHY